jgi:DNA repair exonuclease SbcCD ATPase subunit
MRLIPEEEIDYTATESELARLKTVLDGIERNYPGRAMRQMNTVKSSRIYFSLKGRLESVKSRIYKEANSSTMALVEEKSRLESEKYRLETDINGYNIRIEQSRKLIENNSIERQRLLNEWKELNETKSANMALEFTEPDDNNFICPTCGQEFPEDAKISKLDELRTNFEKEKARRLSWVDG